MLCVLLCVLSHIPTSINSDIPGIVTVQSSPSPEASSINNNIGGLNGARTEGKGCCAESRRTSFQLVSSISTRRNSYGISMETLGTEEEPSPAEEDGTLSPTFRQVFAYPTCFSPTRNQKGRCIAAQYCSLSSDAFDNACKYISKNGIASGICCPIGSIVGMSNSGTSYLMSSNVAGPNLYNSVPSPISLLRRNYNGITEVNSRYCGTTGWRHERIMGGRPAGEGSYPWMAILLTRNTLFCAGSLIDHVHILTAAHCVIRFGKHALRSITVRLGAYNLAVPGGATVQDRRVVKAVRHERFGKAYEYDIAILTLDRPVVMGPTVWPICLSESYEDYAGRTATVAGWGIVDKRGNFAKLLQKVDLQIWRNDRCEASYGASATVGIPSYMMCASGSQQDSCTGDSGGPLVIHNGYRYEQIGIVSWGVGCAIPRYPGVYTRVSHFISWIRNNLH